MLLGRGEQRILAALDADVLTEQRGDPGEGLQGGDDLVAVIGIDQRRVGIAATPAAGRQVGRENARSGLDGLPETLEEAGDVGGVEGELGERNITDGVSDEFEGCGDPECRSTSRT